MKIEIVNNWTEVPIGGSEVYHPSFRDKSTEEIMTDINPEKEWIPYGYNHFIICREVATVFITKLLTN